MQNAIDAVRELEDIAKRNNTVPQFRSTGPQVSLTAEISDTGEILAVEIVDRGVGMTLDVIQNYFLRAGASFRRSEKWKLEHEDTSGSSSVLRTGRFGVGALAAFLLGDEIDVTTRHYLSSENAGYAFKAKIDDDAINITKVTAPIGTKIRVVTPERLRSRIRSSFTTDHQNKIGYGSHIGWYFGAHPIVERRIGDKILEISEKDLLPTDGEKDNYPWRVIRIGSLTIFWTYGHGPLLSCNGIILEGSEYGETNAISPLPPLSNPKIAIRDPDGLIDINLQRTHANLSRFRDDILISTIDDLIIYALLSAPEVPEGVFYAGNYPGFRYPSYNQTDDAKWALTKTGFVFKNAAILADLGRGRVVFGIGGPRGYDTWGAGAVEVMEDGDLAVSVNARGFNVGGNRRKGVLFEAMTRPPGQEAVAASPRSLTFPDELLRQIEAYNPGKAFRRELNQVMPSPINGWCRYGPENNDKLSQSIIGHLGNRIVDDGIIAFSEGKFNSRAVRAAPAETLFSRRWIDVLGTYIIPFRKLERGALLDKMKAANPDVFAKREKDNLSGPTTIDEDSGGAVTDSDDDATSI